MRKMVIVSPQGQLANRIIHFSHFIAVALEYDLKVIHLCFDEFYPLFKKNFVASNNKNIRIILLKNKLFRFMRKAFVRVLRLLSKFVNGNFLLFRYIYLPDGYWLRDDYFQIDMNLFLKEKSGFIFFDGWEFRSQRLFNKHFNVIKELFRPGESIQSLINDELIDLRGRFDGVIGVHIRRGDYRNFLNGKYYYDDDVYLNKMEWIMNSKEYNGKKLVFILCSDEKINTNHFNHFQISYKPRDPIHDLYLLSSCDCIIGPPSTFSYWASVYGIVPLIRMFPD